MEGSAQQSAARRPARRDWLMVAILVFTTIGFLDAAFLTYEHYNGLVGLPCVGASHGVSSCEQVQSSVWSKVDGVSVALLGLIGYCGLWISYWITAKLNGELGRAMGFCIALIGFGFSGYLTYREVFTLHEICEWCVGSAVCMTVLAILTAIRFLRGEQPAT